MFLKYALLLAYGIRRTVVTRGKQINTCFSNTRTRAIFTLVSVRYLLVPDSLSAIVIFFEVLSFGSGHDTGTLRMTLGVAVLVVSVAPDIPRGPTRRVQLQQHQQRVRFAHTYEYISYDT